MTAEILAALTAQLRAAETHPLITWMVREHATEKGTWLVLVGSELGLGVCEAVRAESDLPPAVLWDSLMRNREYVLRRLGQ